MHDHALTIDFHHFRSAGSGNAVTQAVSSHQASAIETDAFNLPTLPGRAVKGLLRDAVRTADELGWYQQPDFAAVAAIMNSIPDHDITLTELLFGAETVIDQTPREYVFGGLVHVSSGLLPEPLRKALKYSNNTPYAAMLHQEIQSTRIDEQTGAAKLGSLRSKVVTIPLTLYAELNLIMPQHGFRNIQEVQDQLLPHAAMIIAHALPLIEQAGADKNRGFGQVTFQLTSQGGSDD